MIFFNIAFAIKKNWSSGALQYNYSAMLDFWLYHLDASNNLSDLLKYFNLWRQLDGLEDQNFSLKINVYRLLD